MCRFATPIEYSLFVLNGTWKQCNECLKSMKALLDLSKDDLRCYQLPVRGIKKRLGPSNIPSGIVWTDVPNRWG